jgi:hypothetical protein
MRDTLHLSKLLRCAESSCPYALLETARSSKKLLHILSPFLTPVINGRSIWFLLSLFPFPREVPPLAVVLYRNITTVTKCFLLFRASSFSLGQRSRFGFMRVFRLIF